jgi:hypothetical protein
MKEYGVHLDVLGSALMAQADERIKWHEHVAGVMGEELEALAAAADAQTKVADATTLQRRTELEKKITGHREHARFLAFVRQNLVSRKRYRLALIDLDALGILPKGRYC